MSDHLVRVTFFLCLTSLVSASVQEILGFQQSEPEAVDLRLEEKKDYYKKWLRQDVTYIITDEEREIFDQLSTDDEKEQFIEEFWRRRDPTRNTLVNEYKEEHYRRIAYANDHFSSGFDGWKTDRGRIYIMYGPPAEILRNPSGGGYDRPVYEGGGATSTYPFETWRYRFIEGMGDEVILEFVDKSWTGEYKLALSPDEKDVWLNNAGGQTLAEQVGMATRFQRKQLQMTGVRRHAYPLMQHRIQDSVFARYEQFARIMAPPELKYPELKEAVSIDVSYDELPFATREDFFRMGDGRFLVPITVAVDNENLTFQLRNGAYLAKIGIYGVVTNLSNRIVGEFEEDLVTSYPVSRIEQGTKGKTLFQKIVMLEPKTRYKVDLIAKDVYGERFGTRRVGIVPPVHDGESIAASSLMLADYIERLDTPADGQSMFVLGDIKVRPSVSGTFPAGGSLGVYLQVYDMVFDQSTLEPSLQVTYRILQGDTTIHEVVDEQGSSIFPYTDNRAVIVRGIPLKGLAAGDYRIEVRVTDRIQEKSVAVTEDFRVESSRPSTSDLPNSPGKNNGK